MQKEPEHRLGYAAIAFFILFFSYLCSAEREASSQVSVTARRPRILVARHDLQAGRDIQAKCYSEGRPTEDFEKVLAWCRRRLDEASLIEIRNVDEMIYEMQVFAFCHLVTPGDRRFAKRAVEIAVEVARMEGVKNPSYNWRRLPCALSVVFDWCYNELTKEEAKILKYDLLKRGIYIRERVNAGFH